MGKYLIDRDLFTLRFNKVNKEKKKYDNKLVKLTNEELKKQIAYYKEQGFEVETYHQEEFGEGWRFIKDGEGLDDIKNDMSYHQLKSFLNECKKEVENKYKKVIKEGNILSLRFNRCLFDTSLRVYNILLKYAEANAVEIITMETLLYLVACIGSLSQTLAVLYELERKGIYIHFIDCNICTGIVTYKEWVEDYIDVLINEYLIEDLLVIMHDKNELSDGDFYKYRWQKKEYDATQYENKEFDKFMEMYY